MLCTETNVGRILIYVKENNKKYLKTFKSSKVNQNKTKKCKIGKDGYVRHDEIGELKGTR